MERYYFYESNKQRLKEEKFEQNAQDLMKNLSVNLINDDNMNQINENIKVDFDLNKTTIGVPLMLVRDKTIKDIVQIYLNKDNENIFKGEQKQNFNIAYFVYVYDTNLVNKIKSGNYKMVIFSEEKLIKEDKNKKILQVTREPELKTGKEYKNIDAVNPNEYIKYQDKKIVKDWRKKK